MKTKYRAIVLRCNRYLNYAILEKIIFQLLIDLFCNINSLKLLSFLTAGVFELGVLCFLEGCLKKGFIQLYL